MDSYPFADLELARRLERTEGFANRAFVAARARLQPEVGAGWIEAGGALAMYDGPASPVTQTFGLGMFEAPTPEALDVIERFFRDRGATVNHETSPLADPSLVALLSSRGYRPIEFSSVMYRPIDLGTTTIETDADLDVRVARIEPADALRWSNAAARGWASEGLQLGEFVGGIGAVQAAATGFHAFLALLDGRDVGAGGMFIHDRTALLAGASTVPEARRRGAQRALLEARLRFAAEAGCDLAMMVALPGSGSQRNAERRAFRIAYTRIKWHA